MEERLVNLQSEIARLNKEMARLRKATFWQRALLSAAIVLALSLSPLGVFAANFIDLNPGSLHNGNINAIADAGISRGCGDTAHYCPDNLVTREEMASFLARTAGLGGNPAVTNAAKLDGYGASGLIRTASANPNSGSVGANNTATVVASASLVAPTDGYVYAVGTVSAMGTANTAMIVVVSMRDMNTGVGSHSSYLPISTLNGPERGTVTVSMVFPAKAGQRLYGIDVSCGSPCLGTASMTANLSLLFTPFGADGSPAAVTQP